MKSLSVFKRLMSSCIASALAVSLLIPVAYAQDPQQAPPPPDQQGPPPNQQDGYDQAPPPSYPPQQLDGMVARIALYPDPLLAQILTAMGVEALLGTQASFDPFIHDECRPHPGQVEVARTIYGLLDGSYFATGADHDEDEANIDDDKGVLRQDRYPLRTSPQFLGPQVEDILSALDTITQECNSSKFRLFSTTSFDR